MPSELSTPLTSTEHGVAHEPPFGAALLARLQAAHTSGVWHKLVLSKCRSAESDLVRTVVRPVTLKGEPQLLFVDSHPTRDITQPMPMTQGWQHLARLLADTYSHAHAWTLTEEWQWRLSKKGKQSLRVQRTETRADNAASPNEALSAQAHDRVKRRHVDVTRPFLCALGVTTADHQVVPAMARKWKQINKFVEVFEHAFEGSRLKNGPRVRVVDFGSGKGYLTFALHDHLRHAVGARAEVLGVELREDMVALCNGVVKRLDLQGLHFDQGDVRTYAPGAIDVMIALHACDTATDHAIHLGIQAGAAIIMCSPCCHKQIRPQLLSPHPMRPILQHGIHLGQQAEMLTDGLRAMLLESQGYATQVFEFVSLEHTSKNKMILAVKRDQPGATHEVLKQVQEIKQFYGIQEHCLESLLNTPSAS